MRVPCIYLACRTHTRTRARIQQKVEVHVCVCVGGVAFELVCCGCIFVALCGLFDFRNALLVCSLLFAFLWAPGACCLLSFFSAPYPAVVCLFTPKTWQLYKYKFLSYFSSFWSVSFLSAWVCGIVAYFLPLFSLTYVYSGCFGLPYWHANSVGSDFVIVVFAFSFDDINGERR